MIVLYYDMHQIMVNELMSIYNCIDEAFPNQQVILLPKEFDLKEYTNDNLKLFYTDIQNLLENIKKEMGDRWLS